ncbi:MAG: glycosyltransferase family 39 protein, partial [Halobacteriaceae archaeon]
MSRSTARRLARRAAPAALAAVAAALVFAVSVRLFPYHSLNHDEAVYLQQAAMLLDGRVNLYPPVRGAFRPWFFVADGARLYPKYAPVPAAAFALGEAAAGTYRLSLAAVAGGNVLACYAVTREAFDRRTGLLAAAFLVASPLFVLDSTVFLPYAPTALLNWTFALAYLRAARTRSRRWAALAGAAVGLAFFSRPFTAVLFAAPFVAHAGYELAVTGGDREAVARQGVVAALGLAGVAVALGYNALVTGSPWLFPYEAFAPRDGIGFGHREILGYAREYTPALAVRANAEAVSLLFGRWVAGGALGASLAALGAALALRVESVRWRRHSPAAARAVLAGLFLSVVA